MEIPYKSRGEKQRVPKWPQNFESAPLWPLRYLCKIWCNSVHHILQRSVRSGSRTMLFKPLRISHPKIDKLACQVAERRESVRKQLRIVFPWAWPSRSETRVRIYSPKAKYLFLMRNVYILILTVIPLLPRTKVLYHNFLKKAIEKEKNFIFPCP